jgi:hypothetical protein
VGASVPLVLREAIPAETFENIKFQQTVFRAPF